VPRTSILAVAGVALLLAGCGSSNSSSSSGSTGSSAGAAAASTSTPAAPAPSTPATNSISLSVRTLPTVGVVLTNAEGHTLYTFAPDQHSKVTCVSACATVWPPLKLASGASPAAPPQLNAKLLGSDPDPAGGRVITYAGWPLYTYEADSAAGQDNGQATESSGGQWYVIAPSGKVITTG